MIEDDRVELLEVLEVPGENGGRHLCMATTLASTTSRSGINSSSQNVVLTGFSDAFQIVVLVACIHKKLMVNLRVPRKHQRSFFQYLHSQNWAGVIQHNEVNLVFQER